MRLAIGLLGVGFLLSGCGSSSDGNLFADPGPVEDGGASGSGGRFGSGNGGGSASDGGARTGSGGKTTGSGGKTTGSGGADADASTGATDAGVEGGSADASLDAAGDGSSSDASPDGAPGTGGASGSGGASGTGGKGTAGTRGSGGAKNDGGPLDEATPGTIFCGGSQCVISNVATYACCIGFPAASCLPTFPGCFVQLGSPTLACDDAADCEGGERCCGTVSGAQAGSACAAACEDDEPQLCRTDSECRRGTKCLPLVATPNYSTCR